MRNLRIAVTLTIAVLTSMLAAGPADAQTNDCGIGSECSGSGTSGGGQIGAEAVGFETGTEDNTPAPVSGAPAWLAPCTWTEANFAAMWFRRYALEPSTQDLAADDGELYWIVECPNSSIHSAGFGDTATGILEIYRSSDGPTQRIIDVLIRDAYQATPVVAFYPSSAPAGTLDIPLITRFPVMLWVEESDWIPVTASASIPGLTVTVTAVPTRTRWEGGHDPEWLTCNRGVAINFDWDWDDQNLDLELTLFDGHGVTGFQAASLD